MNARFPREIPEAFVVVFPPPLFRLGNAGGYNLAYKLAATPGSNELQTQLSP